MTLQAIAIDDEPAALEVLRQHAEQVPFVHLRATFHQPTEALRYLPQHEVDLVFLDVQMPQLLGTDLAAMVQQQACSVVFVTAHAEYAVEGFRLQALDYLLKPVALPRFIEACNRAYQQQTQQRQQPGSFFVKDGYDWVRVELEQVRYLQSDTNLLFIHQAERRITTRMTIGKALELLPADRFVRVHKSYIVALPAVQKLERHQVTVGDVAIPVSASYREELERRLLG